MRRGLLIAYAVLCGLALVPAGFGALMTPMMFDAPTALDSPLTIALALGVLAMPIALGLALAGAILASSRGLRLWHGGLLALPFLDLAALVLVNHLIDAYCNGQFGCR